MYSSLDLCFNSCFVLQDLEVLSQEIVHLSKDATPAENYKATG